MFRDDFDGPAGTLPSATDWLYDTGTNYPGGPANWGTGEIQTYTKDPANLALDGRGYLHITPRLEPDGRWTSARIESKRADFKPSKGNVMRVETRLKLPNPDGARLAGYWPAFWMLGAPYRGNFTNWPRIGEFDIMENVNGAKQIFGTLHCGANPGGPCNETTGIPGRTDCGATTCQGAFHTFRFDWDRSTNPEVLRWSVDDKRYHQIREDQVPASTWAEFTTHRGFFMVLNLAIGGAFPQAENPAAARPGASTTSGVSMVVDYVRVSERAAGTTSTADPGS